VSFFQFLSYGIFITSDSILLVFTLGPEKSRPFINALHFFISIGFLLGTFLVQPFLPASSDKVCSSQTQVYKDPKEFNITSSQSESEEDTDMVDYDPVIPILHGVQSIAWPFIISGGILCLGHIQIHSLPLYFQFGVF
jgi:hypothetical protein